MIANGGREKGNGLPQQEPSAGGMLAEAAFLRKGESGAQSQSLGPVAESASNPLVPRRGILLRENRKGGLWPGWQLFYHFFLLNEDTQSLERNSTVTSTLCS